MVSLVTILLVVVVSTMRLLPLLLLVIFSSWPLLQSADARRTLAEEGAARRPRVRAVSLGGWLVTEGWVKPSLFDGIPNNDLLVRNDFI